MGICAAPQYFELVHPAIIYYSDVFAYKKSYTGIFASIFGVFTSMFWFPAPETSSPQVLEFLAFEMEYLQGAWDAPKILMSLLVPLFFVLLILSAWHRKWKWIVGVIIGAAVLKVLWSVLFSGEAGMSIIIPAMLGIILCVGALYYYFKRQTS